MLLLPMRLTDYNSQNLYASGTVLLTHYFVVSPPELSATFNNWAFSVTSRLLLECDERPVNNADATYLGAASSADC